MTKDITTVRIDSALRYKAKRIGINVSKLLENALKARIEQEYGKDKDLEQMEERLEEVIRKKEGYATEQSVLTDKIVALRAKHEQDIENQVQNAAKQQESVRRAGLLERVAK